MFSHLVESGSHAADFKRRSTFFFGTLAFYGLLLAVAGVGSVYAFNAHLDDESGYEVYAVLRFQPASETPREPARPETRPAAAAPRAPQFATRPEVSHLTPYRGDRIAAASTREVKARTPVIIAPFHSDPPPGGFHAGPEGTGAFRPPQATGDGPRVLTTDPPPPVPPRPAPAATPAPRPEGPLRLSATVISGKAVHKPIPAYPAIARHARIEGVVTVLILVDEQGRVASARATSGPPLLLHAATQAALQARFTPTLLGGNPVKVTGVITYHFTLR